MSNRYYQEWPQIIVLTAVLAALCSYWLLTVSWGWHGSLGDFLNHLPHIRKTLIDVLGGAPIIETDYWDYISTHGLEAQWIAHLILPIFSSVILAGAVSMRLLYVKGGRDRANHVSGPRLMIGKYALRHAKSMLKRELKGDAMGKGISIFPRLEVTARRELDNLFIYGKQGAGKGVVAKPIIKQVIERDDWLLIYDEKREYTEIFLSKSTILLSPTDRRSEVWNPSLDIVNQESAALLAECLISEVSEDSFWVNGARLILVGCIIYLINCGQAWGWRELNSVLNKSAADLNRLMLIHFPVAAKLIEEDSKTTQSLFAVISTQLSWLPMLAKLWPESHKSSFSVANWLSESTERKVIIIANNPLYKSISSPLCTAFVSLSTEQLLALSDSDERRVWFSLDELGNLSKTSILRLLALGRAKGGRVLAGIQAVSMLRKIYGQDDAESILSLFGNIITLNTGSAGDSARKASEALGERVVEIPSRSVDGKGGVSYTHQQQSELVVTASDITQLPKSNSQFAYGYLLVNGWNAIYRLDWPVIDFPKISKAYEPVDSLLKEPQNRQRKSKRGSRGRE